MAALKNHAPKDFQVEQLASNSYCISFHYVTFEYLEKRICLDIVITTVDVFIILFRDFTVPLDQIPVSFSTFSIEFNNSENTLH